MPKTKGDIEGFNKSWRKKKSKTWFYRGEPQNQIEYAFGQHWSFLKDYIGVPKKGTCVEVGAGRGSLSAFFADNGYNVTLVDLSDEIMAEAEKVFKSLGLSDRAKYVVSDALDLKLEDESFDVATSVGLLEHFEDPTDVIAEQVRVVKKGGMFTAYVVPKKWSSQNLFQPVNDMLKKTHTAFTAGIKKPNKVPLYRTEYGIEHYKKIMQKIGLKGIGGSGVYPYPAISYSPEFPFTVMPPYFEKMLVSVFKNLSAYRAKTQEHPWMCEEAICQGFFIWGQK